MHNNTYNSNVTKPKRILEIFFSLVTSMAFDVWPKSEFLGVSGVCKKL